VQTWKANKSVLVKSWLLIPIGVLVMLLLIMGVTVLISLTGISFPASVLLLAGNEVEFRWHVCLHYSYSCY